MFLRSVPLIFHSRIGLQREISHWVETFIMFGSLTAHLAAPLSSSTNFWSICSLVSGSSFTIFCTAPLLELATTLLFSVMIFGSTPIDALSKYIVSFVPLIDLSLSFAISQACFTIFSYPLPFPYLPFITQANPLAVRKAGSLKCPPLFHSRAHLIPCPVSKS